jgi:decaprenylphospho-beta-D-erythro-pentofuranosid-2-ulose 2-reductase
MKKVLALGGTSKIAHETLKCFASGGAQIFLVGRDPAKLSAVASDLAVRGAETVETAVLELNDFSAHPNILRQALKCLDNVDVVLIAYGTLSDQARCQLDADLTRQELNTNFLSVVSLLTILANYFEVRRQGCIAVIGSVAGDRGRQSNYVYGAAKGGLNIFLQGLRNRLFRSGVSVITVKPGFVHTPMTASLPKNFLYADPALVGRKIFDSIIKRRDVVYVPWFWRWVMLVIKLVPETIFKRGRL